MAKKKQMQGEPHTQSQDSTAKRGQFRSGFSSAVTQKTTLTEKKALAVKKPQSDGSMTAEISDTPRIDEGCRTKKGREYPCPFKIML